ncbi:MAG TPA: HupE/UreJ family protein [Opitutaceae bacterium]|nr:HupE/UreJ family protein [Opitutaceae bacterium]
MTLQQRIGPLHKRRPPFWLLVALALLPCLARAHNPIASWARLELRDDRMELRVEMATESAWLFIGETLDRAPDMEGSMPRLRMLVSQAYALSVGDRVLTPRQTVAEFKEDDAVELTLVYERPTAASIHCDALYLQRLPADHRSTLTLLDETGKTVRTELLTRDKHAVDLTLPPRATTASAMSPKEASDHSATSSVSAPTPQATASFAAFFRLGVEHILTGYDHLLFLLGLLVVCRRWSSMLTIITCFTLAHSVTLALAALNVVSLPSRIVEPLIAASIVFVGIENLVRRGEPKGRWVLTFIFGLVHGFGFAGVLREIGLGAGGTSVALPLVSFNLGVEAGQLAVVAILLPLLLALRGRPLLECRVAPAVSAVVMVLGAYWLLQRTLVL